MSFFGIEISHMKSTNMESTKEVQEAIRKADSAIKQKDDRIAQLYQEMRKKDDIIQKLNAQKEEMERHAFCTNIHLDSTNQRPTSQARQRGGGISSEPVNEMIKGIQCEIHSLFISLTCLIQSRRKI